MKTIKNDKCYMVFINPKPLLYYGYGNDKQACIDNAWEQFEKELDDEFSSLHDGLCYNEAEQCLAHNEKATYTQIQLQIAFTALCNVFRRIKWFIVNKAVKLWKKCKQVAMTNVCTHNSNSMTAGLLIYGTVIVILWGCICI